MSKIRQASCIPFRLRDGVVEFCLITSRNSGRWVVPKGKVEEDEKPKACALREAEEEAGVHGVITGKSLGRYVYKKKGNRYRVKVFLMRVDRIEEDFKEKDQRERRWVRAEEAVDLVEPKGLAELVAKAAASLGPDLAD